LSKLSADELTILKLASDPPLFMKVKIQTDNTDISLSTSDSMDM
jgi:hypothetical protein